MLNPAVMQQEKIYYFHAPATFKNRCTIAAKILPTNEMVFAVSRCGDKDQFSRKTGRAIATGRLEKGKYYQSPATVVAGENWQTEIFNKERFVAICLVICNQVSPPEFDRYFDLDQLVADLRTSR